MKVKIVTFLFLATSISLNSFAITVPYQKQIQTYNDKNINYYIIQSDQNKSNDLLVLIQGSDCKSVVNNPGMVKKFGAAFPNNDILLVEKTGLNNQVGKNGEEASEEECPVEYMKKDSPLERAENYLVVLNSLKESYHNIILLGGSEGALVTNIIASKADFITASIALNVGGQFFIDDVIYSIQNNTPAEEVNNSVEGFKQFAKAAQQKQLDENQFVSGHGTTWWYEMLTIDNLKLIQTVKNPHLVIQTMADTNVDAYSTVKMMNKNTNLKVSFKTYQGLDHFFEDNKGKSHDAMIVKDIQNWYQSMTR